MNLSNIFLLPLSYYRVYPKGWEIVLPIMIVLLIVKIFLRIFEIRKKRKQGIETLEIQESSFLKSVDISDKTKKRLKNVGYFILIFTTVLLLLMIYLMITGKNEFYNEVEDKRYYLIPGFGFLFVYYYLRMSLSYLQQPKEFDTLRN